VSDDRGCDWNAGVPACNVAFFSGVKLLRSQIAQAFSCFALMQAGTPAFQSVGATDDSVTVVAPTALELFSASFSQLRG
jgi:hypothetical protein